MKLSSSNSSILLLYSFILFVSALESLRPWFLWTSGSYQYIIPTLLAIISFFIVFTYPILFSFNTKSVLLIILIFMLARFVATRGNFNAFIATILTSLNVLIFIGLKDKYKIGIVSYLSRAFAILFGISLFFWIIFLLGAELPNYTVAYGYSEIRNEAEYYFRNYYFFINNSGTKFTDLSQIILPRFSSIVLEPGYLGLLMVIFLYINHFDLRKKYNIVFLLVLLFTFSLAGWLIGLFSYIIYSLRNRKNKLIFLMLISSTIFILFLLFSKINSGHNVINEFIISRLSYDDSKGSIVGYNRTLSDFDDWFDTNFLKGSDLMFGTDLNKVFGQSTNVGWKPFVAKSGFVGLFLYFLFLFYFFMKNSNYYSLGFLIIYILIFLRGHHEIYWSVFPILYIGGCAFLENESKQSTNPTLK